MIGMNLVTHQKLGMNRATIHSAVGVLQLVARITRAGYNTRIFELRINQRTLHLADSFTLGKQEVVTNHEIVLADIFARCQVEVLEAIAASLLRNSTHIA